MIYPKFPECKIKWGIEQNEDAMVAWVEDMISIAIEHSDLRSRIARDIFEEVHSAGYSEGAESERVNNEGL
jgi:hypothetical protein